MALIERIKNGPKAVKMYITAGILALLAVGGLIVFRHIKLKSNPSEMYETVIIDYGNVNKTVSGTAKLEFDTTVAVFVESAQTVKRLHVKEGDYVTEGQLLVEYDIEHDTAELNRRLEEAKLYLKNAKLNLQAIAQPADGNQLLQYQAQVTAAQKSISDTQGEIESLEGKAWQQELRMKNLKEIAEEYENDESVSAIDYETAYTNYRVAKAGLRDLEAQLEAKEKALEFQQKQLADAQKKLENAQSPLTDETAKIKYSIQQNIVKINELSVEQLEEDLSKLAAQTLSPVTGYVSAVHIVEGESTSQGYAILELAQKSQPVAALDVSEYDAPLLKEGQRAELNVGALPDGEFDGIVSKIYAQAIEKDGSGNDEMIVPVKVVLSDSDERLKAGYTADVRIIVEERTEVLYVPIQALVTQNGESYVYIIRDKRIERQNVVPGMYGDKTVEITEGLTHGDMIALNYQAA